jgi:peroxiredoxin
MAKLSRHRVLIAGVLSPLAALALLVFLSYFSEHWNARFHAPVLAILLAMLGFTALPFSMTVLLARSDYRRQTFSIAGKIGVGIAAISLIVPAWTAYGLFSWWREGRNVRLHDVPAPVFRTLDLEGVNRSLSDQKGKVVLVNVWGTWCPSCRAEMPELDRLYREHKNEGLVVFGLSDEDAATQKKCLDKIPVTYPLLTYKGEIPPLYRQVMTYPTTFLIDRNGQLQGGSEGEDSFAQLQTATLTLLHSEAESGNLRRVDQ